jgi:hypothetical protein
MSARLNYFFAILAAVFAFGFTAAAPHRAEAGTTGGGGGCCVVTPPCCKPSPPPCCTPSPPPSCCGGGHQINIPNVNVNVGATVVVNASASATAVGVAGANASSNSGAAVYFGGGGSSFGITQSSGLIQGLNVEGQSASIRTPYSATRTKIRTVVIQAVCIDDQEIPHPASQVGPDRDVADSYEGEVFRCIAGTHMQWTMADFSGKIAFDHGQVINCAKGEALFKSASGELACRPQRPARDCNERSLLRRFGAGVKVIKIVTVETYQAFKEETVQTGAVATGGMSIDGGVGGIVY